MEDAEQATPSKNQTSPATKSHRLATALATFGARVIAVQLEDAALPLSDCATTVLAGDPTLRRTLTELLQRPQRGPLPALDHPCARLFNLAQGNGLTLHKVDDTLHKVSQSGVTAGRVALAPPEVPPSPQTPYPPPTSPTPTEITLRPSDGALVPSAGSDEHPNRLCFKAVAGFMWTADRQAGLPPRTRARTAVVVKQIRETLAKEQVPPEDQPAYIAQNLTAERWANVTGGKPKTIENLERNWYDAMFGADAKNGRSNGKTVGLRQTLYQSAAQHTEESFSAMAARKGRRD